ncbi:MAG: LuxR C-terminal-related transcriptional regulator [Spirochaetaceae bacterium]|nr:LuxR C-terminal-related transcriptional regulator [Spirochaetaceae bacterium]
MSRQARFERILASLHEAMFDDSHWVETSALIDEACGAKGNHLVFQTTSRDDDIAPLFMRFCYRGEHRSEWEREYLANDYPADEHLPRLRQLPGDRIVHVTELLSEAQLKHSATYNEIMPRYHFQDGLNVRLDGPRGSRIVWGIADPSDGKGWSTDQVDMVARLLPHVRQFVRMRHALVEARGLQTTLERLLDNTRAGVIQLDRQKRVVAANDRARELLCQGTLLSDRAGLLHLAVPIDNSHLQRLLDRALPRFGGQGESGSMVVRHPNSYPPLIALHVTPVEDRDTGFRSVRPAALVLAIEPNNQGRIDRKVLRTNLGLSAAESEVAALVAEGKSIREVRGTIGRGEHTVRWHIKQAYAKLGVSCRAEFTKLVQAVGGILPRDEGALDRSDG